MFEQIDFEPFKKAFLENESELQAIGDAQRAMNHLLVSLCKIVLQKSPHKRHLPFAAPLGARAYSCMFGGNFMALIPFCVRGCDFLRTSFHDCRRVLFAVGLQAPCTDDDSSQAHHTYVHQILALSARRD